ncbi:DUF2846 domain-containing protein [Pseudoxanthomonas sp. CF125]|uniref:DUF2846 domain-containing protein n=1 Tax=Pseudoxanthomonas sp. CF125 TaxID=1855303 RepID=UPI000886BFBF|nr:DUF2846 domain-containing protein [Pseudoxanthomonas sp. CF125]SDQ59418.1 Protein of unknown function [Pseudoxanthomonas sp. CF125]
MYSKLHRSLLVLALLCPAYAYAQTETAEPAAAEAAAAETAEPAAEATEAVAEEAGDATAAPAASGSIGAPPAGKGQIVFFREKKFVGGGVSYKVREGENELGKLSNGTFFVSVVEPGAHEYTVHSEAKDILNLEVEAGETYYVTGGITMGVFAGRPNLSPSDQAAFDALAGKLKPAKPIKKK